MRRTLGRSAPNGRLTPLLVSAALLAAAPAPPEHARIVVDATRVEGQIDARLYGQFLEFMYEGIKGGLSAELDRAGHQARHR